MSQRRCASEDDHDEAHQAHLRKWNQQHEIDVGEREGLSSSERERLKELERENARLRMERNLLKRAAAFFAKETETR